MGEAKMGAQSSGYNTYLRSKQMGEYLCLQWKWGENITEAQEKPAENSAWKPNEEF